MSGLPPSGIVRLLAMGFVELVNALRGDTTPNQLLNSNMSLRNVGDAEKTPLRLVEVVSALAVAALISVLTLAALMLLGVHLLHVAGQGGYASIGNHAWGVTGCAVAFGVVIAALESIRIGAAVAVVQALVGQIGLAMLAIAPAAALHVSHSGDLKHASYPVFGLAVGVGAAFASMRTGEGRSGLPVAGAIAGHWRALEVVLGTVGIAVVGIALFWLSQMVKRGEDHNAVPVGMALGAGCLLALVIFRKGPQADPKAWSELTAKSVLIQHAVPAAIFAFIGVCAGFVIQRPSLNADPRVASFGAGFITGLVGALVWVLTHWCVSPLLVRRALGVTVELGVLLIVAVALVSSPFHHISQGGRWYALAAIPVGAGVGALAQIVLRSWARGEQRLIRRQVL